MKTLIEAREATGLSRERFAALIGMAPQQLRCYEVGTKRPGTRNARRLAAALGVEPEDIAEFAHIAQREQSELEIQERMAKDEKVG